VRVLMDAYGASNAPEDEIEELKRAGAQIAEFRPISFRSLNRIHRRSHMRAIVIDGKIGYTGGLAFRDDWLSNGQEPDKWRDAMFKFDGHLARATQDHFNSIWRQTVGEILTGGAFYPPLPINAEIRPDSYFVSLFHSPAPDVSANLLDIIWLSITGAQEYIYLSTPYLTPQKEIIDALLSAVERGVRVEVIVPGPHVDSNIIKAASRAYYETLLDGGVKIYEYQPGLFHEKSLVVDGRWSLIGSANMDNRSATLNVENVFGIEDKEFGERLETHFLENKSLTMEVTRESWNPNVLKRGYYLLTTLFVKQF